MVGPRDDCRGTLTSALSRIMQVLAVIGLIKPRAFAWAFFRLPPFGGRAGEGNKYLSNMTDFRTDTCQLLHISLFRREREKCGYTYHSMMRRVLVSTVRRSGMR